jgi:hypothetical protein
MFTLNQVTKETKSVFKWGVISVVVVILIFLGIKIGGIFKEAFFPTPAPKPTVSFGKLPQIVFPQNSQNYSFTYSVDTLTGKLPQFSDRINVYKMNQGKADLLAFERIKNKATAIGFTQSPTPVSDGIYQWADQSQISKKLTLSALGNQLALDSNFYSDDKILSGRNLPSESQATEMAKTFLTNAAMYPDQIDETKTKTTLFTIKNYTLLPSTSFSGSQVIQVNFFQKDINEKPTFYNSPFTPNISVYIAGGDSSQIVKADYFYQQKSDENATYPIKTTQQAFEELQNGKAFFASAPSGQEQISIKDVSLGYYIPNKEQEYLMPIIVFSGSNGFYAYVSAVTDEWISN